jgi:hydroxymethylglutaryl-CoA reductase
MKSRTSEFCLLTHKERLDRLKLFSKMSEEEIGLFSPSNALGLEMADRMIENVVGFMPIPLGIATGLIVNGKEYLVPMATEQKSVISLVTAGAECTRATGGFKVESTASTMIGQVQLMKVHDFQEARQAVSANKERILQEANTQSRTRRAVDIEVRTVDSAVGRMLIVELLVDVKDSMGANVVDSMCEAVAPMITSLTGGNANVRIVSSLATRRLVHVEATVMKDNFEGVETIDRIVSASAFAESDPSRAVTHNKGIMNAVSAVVLATCNDTRAVEAGAHAYAAMSGQYLPLSVWHKDEEGSLLGKLTMPMAVGIVGGAISTHPTASIALKIMGVKTAKELGAIAASAGLAYNLIALHALVTRGIGDT